MFDDPREKALRDAIYRAIGRPERRASHLTTVLL